MTLWVDCCGEDKRTVGWKCAATKLHSLVPKKTMICRDIHEGAFAMQMLLLSFLFGSKTLVLLSPCPSSSYHYSRRPRTRFTTRPGLRSRFYYPGYTTSTTAPFTLFTSSIIPATLSFRNPPLLIPLIPQLITIPLILLVVLNRLEGLLDPIDGAPAYEMAHSFWGDEVC